LGADGEQQHECFLKISVLRKYRSVRQSLCVLDPSTLRQSAG
jgi:hypothetical protein